jgi:hypothetical protein
MGMNSLVRGMWFLGAMCQNRGTHIKIGGLVEKGGIPSWVLSIVIWMCGVLAWGAIETLFPCETYGS